MNNSGWVGVANKNAHQNNDNKRREWTFTEILND